MKTKYKCEKCHDTGCQCGGIGLTCHGCCDCGANPSYGMTREYLDKNFKPATIEWRNPNDRTDH